MSVSKRTRYKPLEYIKDRNFRLRVSLFTHQIKHKPSITLALKDSHKPFQNRSYNIPCPHTFQNPPSTSPFSFSPYVVKMGSLGKTETPRQAQEALFYQSIYPSAAPFVESADGVYFTLENGQHVLDSTGGAAVSALGHGNQRVKNAITKQLNKFTYAHPGYFQNRVSHELANILVESTDHQLARALLLGSGRFGPPRG